MKTPTFEGKVAAITGAGSGIGRALAQALAARGCALALSDVNDAGLQETAASCSQVKVTAAKVDVSSREAVERWANETAAAHGRVNLVFNNAGISYGATVSGGDPDEFRRVIEVNFFGVVHGTRAFLPLLEASQDGHVVNISSIFGIIGFPGQAAYNSAKFAVRGFSEVLIIELKMMGSTVRVTCVHPGGVRTNIGNASKLHDSLVLLGSPLEKLTANLNARLSMDPARAADIILNGVRRNAHRVLVGADAKALDLLQRLLPGSYQGLVAGQLKRELSA